MPLLILPTYCFSQVMDIPAPSVLITMWPFWRVCSSVALMARSFDGTSSSGLAYLLFPLMTAYSGETASRNCMEEEESDP